MSYGARFEFATFNDPADKPFDGHTFNQLLGINNFGLIAGFYGSGAAGDPNQGYLLSPPFFIPVNYPGVPQTQLTGLNDHGTLVGYFYPTNKGTAVDNQFGFYEKDGKFVEVNNPNTPKQPPNGNLIENQLLGVNDSDIAVGFYNDKFGNSHGYTYDINTGKFSADINFPNAVSTVAAAINNAGAIAGFYTDSANVTHGFLKDDGEVVSVDAPGASTTELLGLNDFGLAVGFDVVGGVTHGIIYDVSTQTFATLDDPHASGLTEFNGINDRGDIVGFYMDSKGNTDGLLARPSGQSFPGFRSV